MASTDFRADALKHKSSMSQTVAKMFAGNKLMRARIMIRCPSVYELLPEIRCVVFKVPLLANPGSSSSLEASVAAVQSSGVPFILWTEESSDNVETIKSIAGMQSLDATSETCIVDTVRLVQGGSSVLWSSTPSKELQAMVQNLQEKLGPALYYGDHEAALTSSAVGVAYADAPPEAKAAASAISLSDHSDGLTGLWQWKAIANDVNHHPMRASGGCCAFSCALCVFGLQGICCACRCCPYNPEKQAQKELEALSAVAREAPTQKIMA